jgi:aspartate racemase
MQLLGLIGGMSWESTIEYYRIINEMVTNKLGSWNSAKILLYSVNFEEILPLQNNDDWGQIRNIMIEICKKLETVGSSAIVICSNTMHKVADGIEENISIPIINVIDETAKAIKAKNLNSIGLLGTKFTMEGGFYVNKLVNKYTLDVKLPNKEERDYIHNTIYNEFGQGKFLDSTKKRYLKIINNLKEKGCEGIILGCTEIPLLIKQEDVDLPLFDTLKIHLEAAVDFMIKISAK